MELYGNSVIKTLQENSIYLNFWHGNDKNILKVKKPFFFLQIIALDEESLETFLLYESVLMHGLKNKKNASILSSFKYSIGTSLINSLQNQSISNIDFEELIYNQKVSNNLFKD